MEDTVLDLQSTAFKMKSIIRLVILFLSQSTPLAFILFSSFTIKYDALIGRCLMSGDQLLRRIYGRTENIIPYTKRKYYRILIGSNFTLRKYNRNS